MIDPDVFVHHNLIILTEYRNDCIRHPMTCRNLFYQILDKWLKAAFWMNWNFVYLSIRIYMSIKRVTKEMDLSYCFLWLALALKSSNPSNTAIPSRRESCQGFHRHGELFPGMETEPATALWDLWERDLHEGWSLRQINPRGQILPIIELQSHYHVLNRATLWLYCDKRKLVRIFMCLGTLLHHQPREHTISSMCFSWAVSLPE